MARILPFVVGQYLIGWGIGEKASTSDRKSGKNTETEKYLWIQRVTNILFVCISLLMSKAVTPTNTLLLHIKVFLTCCYRFGTWCVLILYETLYLGAGALAKNPLRTKVCLTKTVTKSKGKKGTKQCKVPHPYCLLNTAGAQMSMHVSNL